MSEPNLKGLLSHFGREKITAKLLKGMRIKARVKAMIPIE